MPFAWQMPHKINCVSSNCNHQRQKTDQTYVGLTSNTFKTRFAYHKTSLTNVNKKHGTELSKHVWKLKDKSVDYIIKWKIIKQAKPYSNNSNRCNLCLWEKYFILCHPSLATLNKRNELVASCRHANKFLLRNFVTKIKLMPFIFKLAANLLLEFVCSHVYSQHRAVNDCKSTVPFKFLQLKLLTPTWDQSYVLKHIK